MHWFEYLENDMWMIYHKFIYYYVECQLDAGKG